MVLGLPGWHFSAQWREGFARRTRDDPTLEKIVSGRPPTSSGTTRRPADILSHTMTTIWRPHWLIKHIIPVKEEVPDDDVPDVKVEPPADDDGINAEDEKTHLEGKGAKRKRGPPTKGPCEHGVKYRSKCKVCQRLSARSSALSVQGVRWGSESASTVVSALSARSAVVHQSASTVVCALSARSAVGHQSASTVVSALSARSAVGHKSASTVVCALSARSAVGDQSASTVVSARKCKECGGGSICEHGRRRSECKECGGGSICEHGRIRYRCNECEK